MSRIYNKDAVKMAGYPNNDTVDLPLQWWEVAYNSILIMCTWLYVTGNDIVITCAWLSMAHHCQALQLVNPSYSASKKCPNVGSFWKDLAVYAFLLFVWLHKQSLTVSHDLTGGLQAIKPESFATTQEIIFLAHQGQSPRGISNVTGRHPYAIFPTCAWAVLPLISTRTARNVQEVNLSLLDMKNNPIPSQSMHTYQKETDTKAGVYGEG
ncbi:hypothetical protein BKA83DRAFT_4126821 [Pisolithus microcarpus]|nr:hypothetical protein BKA83DRAFT_4126821 [Pisolithus microcarpus]